MRFLTRCLDIYDARLHKFLGYSWRNKNVPAANETDESAQHAHTLAASGVESSPLGIGGADADAYGLPVASHRLLI